MQRQRVEQSLARARDELLRQRSPEGFWPGYLSSSALSTATAISALASASPGDRKQLLPGLAWLGANQNADGGWGDTPDSPSNVATTVLTLAAIHLAGAADYGDENKNPPVPGLAASASRARAWLAQRGIDLPHGLPAALAGIYGQDHTFAVPILMNAALAGLASWQDIPALPFELAVLPHWSYRALRLGVVSYALPALIAIGLALHRQNPRALPQRIWRHMARTSALRRLAAIQPQHGGFLDAVPLTSFVAMALTAAGENSGSAAQVRKRCLEFLRSAMRGDGSWPIDSDLSVWLTTASLAALAEGGMDIHQALPESLAWVAARQHKQRHAYTGAAAGGWAWTHRAGGVPDVDDTSGALLALAAGGNPESLEQGRRWLLNLQNSDGGWPTFCRGWGKLPFDRSAPDLTAHALRALHATGYRGPALARGLAYLGRVQRDDGAWLPLWFGHQLAVGQGNPVLGTARVLRVYEVLGPQTTQARAGRGFLLSAQKGDGGWGATSGNASGVEETALALSALAAWPDHPQVRSAVQKGLTWLVPQVEQGGLDHPAPIGLYFASLWYSEHLYPLIWTVDALERILAASGQFAFDQLSAKNTTQAV